MCQCLFSSSHKLVKKTRKAKKVGMAADGAQPTKLLPRVKAKKEIGAKLKFNTTATKCYQSCVSETQDPKQSVIQAKKIDIKL